MRWTLNRSESLNRFMLERRWLLKETLFLVLMFVAALVVVPAPQAQTQIPSEPTNLPDYVGTPAKAWPVANSRVPQNPFLAPNPLGGVHLDGWNSDTADLAGPLGRDPVVWTSSMRWETA